MDSVKVVGLILLVALAACAPVDLYEVDSKPIARFTVEGIEGQPIVLSPQAEDPDRDKLTYLFELPFDANGRWETKLGDEGEYVTTVTVEDGRGGRASERVFIVVHHQNRAPSIDCTSVRVAETDMIDLTNVCTITDVENDALTITYAGWMSTPMYETTYEDAGVHEVTITVSDGKLTTSWDLPITVMNTNRAPVFEDFPSEITGTEGDLLTLPRWQVRDPDGDALTITYAAPFSTKGTWQTDLGDAGVYNVTITVDDGTQTVARSLTVRLALRNTAPQLKPIPDLTVREGEVVKLPISALDREGDALALTIVGWMNTQEYQTTYEDAGVHEVTVEVSDGKEVVRQRVKITVLDENRPPYFVTPA